ncbi:MAG: tRNA uridine-5-carboxymethylaminomethyl(34) synthesis GTPase MnmE [Epulopiscium sp. Nele67-Bin004]|nr:MAG: tRNA uridine-5-carboxymethylaminomethyl(34) synthesis GTPase MnmE [Epulopiscium sp. Nele67-Bin004]
MFDTITAISTARGVGAIGIVRISGDEAIAIASKIFKGYIDIKNAKSHTIHYGHIVDIDNNIIDEVLVMLMRAPKTFTREDVVEINCHGGIVVLERVLMEVVRAGARLAEPGEFSKRAFLNGRIDLSQVEAIMDIIDSKTDLSLKQAIGQLEGKLSTKIKHYQTELIAIISTIEVSIDYPEYEEYEIERENIQISIHRLLLNLRELLKTADTGQMVREGIKTVIIGEPNVGKSSLLNTLLAEDKAIVTDIAGTTRDIVEAYFNIEGIPFVLLDTAGIRETDDVVEKIGVEKSLKCVENANLILMVIDASKSLSDGEIDIIGDIKNKKVIYILNKTDLEQLTLDKDIRKLDDAAVIVKISTANNFGIEELQKIIKDRVVTEEISVGAGATISNQRQKEALIKAIQSLEKAYESIADGMPEDCLAIDLHDAYGHLGMIIGEELKEEIINELFERFCLGK